MQSVPQLHETIPMLHRCVLDIPSNSVVRVVTLHGVTVEGHVMQNPKETATTDWLEMINCKYIDPKLYGSRRKLSYNKEEISDLIIISSPTPKIKLKAVVMDTIVVTEGSQLQKVMESFELVKVVGLAFHGDQVGRQGMVGIISMNCLGTLVIIDIESLGCNMEPSDVWRILGQHLFENQEMVKVVHSVLPIADYLYHQHAIKIENVFDIQMAEVYTTIKNPPLDNVTTENIMPSTLDDLLTKYLSHLVIKEEIEIYKNFRTILDNESFFVRPFIVDETTKGIAISVKYLIQLKNILTQKLMEHYKICVEAQMSSVIDGGLLEMINFVGKPELLSAKTADQVAQMP